VKPIKTPTEYREQLMFVRKFCATLGATTVVASGLAFAAVSPASAAPTPATYAEPQFTVAAGDFIGTGSDTTQFVVGDLAHKYNTTVAAGGGPRIASYASCQTPVAYDSCLTYADDPSVTITLPGSATAINRPKSSGDGRKLLAGTTNQPGVLFARSSGVVKNTDAEFGKITGYPFAVDSLVLVTANTTNAPATLTAKQILDIFAGTVTNWAQVGGKSGAIHAYVPQSGSGTRDFFTGQLKTVNGGTDVSATSLHDKQWNTATNAFDGAKIQEHNPTSIKDDPNAIAPFSLGRIALTGNLVKAVKGFQADRSVYNYVRKSSEAANAAGGAAWTEGGSVVEGLFGENGFFCAPAQRQLIADEGFFQLKTSTEDPNGQCGVPNDTTGATPATVAAGLGKVSTTTATVTDGTASTPAKVAVTVTGSNPTGDVVLNLGSYTATATLAGGAASFTVPTTLTAGTYDVNVSYLGDAANETSGFPKLASQKLSVTVADTQPCATATTAAASALTAFNASSAKATAAKKAASAAAGVLTAAKAKVAAAAKTVAAKKAAVTKAKKAVKKAHSKAKKAKAKKKLKAATKALKAATGALTSATSASTSAGAKSAAAATASAAAVKDLGAKQTALTNANDAKAAACA
jgi:ABC-type phosphate transport system substrate-binding protein